MGRRRGGGGIGRGKGCNLLIAGTSGVRFGTGGFGLSSLVTTSRSHRSAIVSVDDSTERNSPTVISPVDGAFPIFPRDTSCSMGWTDW